MPAGCPHRVENLATSLAISANFVDASNFPRVVRELEVCGWVDDRARDLHRQITESGFDTRMDFNEGNIPWTEFSCVR